MTTKQKIIYSAKEWRDLTEEQLKELQDIYKYDRVIGELFGKTAGAVRHKRERFGISPIRSSQAPMQNYYKLGCVPSLTEAAIARIYNGKRYDRKNT